MSTFALALVTTSIGVSAAGAGGTTCEVVKEAEVERAIGHDVTAADPPQGIGGTCSFTVDGAPADAVNVWVLDGEDAEDRAQGRQADRWQGRRRRAEAR